MLSRILGGISVLRRSLPRYSSSLNLNSQVQSKPKSKPELAKNGFRRTHYVGQLGIEHEGQKVTICGWIQKARLDKFFLLRDIHGIVQVFLSDELMSNKDTETSLKAENVVRVSGVIRRRPLKDENPKMKTGLVELVCDHLEVLNPCSSPLPFQISKYNRANETIRLKYRYLDLRFEDMQRNLIFRSDFVHRVRHFLHEAQFHDIETPTLFRRTPGGAREFIVPTRNHEEFYCLTQSPQQFKQLLMVAGMDKYYQIARCYRDENTKPERQPEFTQIDIEMSFVDENDCMHLIESLIENCWPSDLTLQKRCSTPFQRITFDEAMKGYGSDKPDLRFDMKFQNVTNIFQEKASGMSKIDIQAKNEKFKAHAFKIPQIYGEFNLKQIDKAYKEIFEKTFFNQSDIPSKESFLCVLLNGKKGGSSIAKFLTEEVKEGLFKELSVSDELVVLLVSQNEAKLLEILGKLRLNLADLIDEETKKQPTTANRPLLRDPNLFKFEWVVDFPLFTRNEETNELESSHHPFTAPRNEHLDLVKESKDLESVIGLHYDLVLNGQEIAGGSIRIHCANLQRHVLSNILKEDTGPLEHLISALAYGAPPHGGIALGLDRLVAILCGTTNIRNVIAFPKAQSGRDLMGSAPSKINQSELDYYRIQCEKLNIPPNKDN